MKNFYPNIHKTQIKAGVFTLVVLVAMVLGYLWLSSTINMRSQRDLRIGFDDVAGLEIGDKVMYRGMEVGRVRKVEARSEDILVTVRIRRDIELKESAIFQIGNSSLMGGTGLSISQGTGKTLDYHKIQRGVTPSGMMALMDKAMTTMTELNGIMAELRKDEGLIGKSELLLDDAGSAVRSVDKLAMDTNREITQALDKIDLLTAEVNKIVKSNSDNVSSVLGKTPGTMANLNSTLDSLQVLSERLGRTISDVQGGKGTAGRLLNDEELYGRLLESVNNLDVLVKDIKANPKKYVKFSIF